MKVFTIIILTVFSISLPLFAGGKDDSSHNVMEGAMMEAEMMDSEEMESDGMMPKDTMGGLMDYAGMDQAMIQAESQPVVLFFYASWCPSCKSAIKDLEERESDLGNIQVLVVDYDNSDDLQMKYSVSYQHTFVQIDGSGNALATWNGGNTETILTNTLVEEM